MVTKIMATASLGFDITPCICREFWHGLQRQLHVGQTLQVGATTKKFSDSLFVLFMYTIARYNTQFPRAHSLIKPVRIAPFWPTYVLPADEYP